MEKTEHDVLELIKSLNIIPPGSKDLSANIPLKEQGIDSLDMMTLFLNLEEKFGVKIPDAEIDNLVSIDRIAEYLNRVL